MKSKYCNKCLCITKHRKVNNNRKSSYFNCSICSEKSSKRYRQKYWLRYLSQKANVRKDKVSTKVTEEMLQDLMQKQNHCCALTGLYFSMNEMLYRPSLDRINSKKGYEKDNLQLVLFIVNKMKRELDQTEFIEICTMISNHLQIEGRYYGT